MRVPREVMAILNAISRAGAAGLRVENWGDYQAAKAAQRLGYVRLDEAPDPENDPDLAFLTDHGRRIVGPTKARVPKTA